MVTEMFLGLQKLPFAHKDFNAGLHVSPMCKHSHHLIVISPELNYVMTVHFMLTWQMEEKSCYNSLSTYLPKIQIKFCT